ncbi:polysaccharide deacetylase family protein [Streptomyces sp. SID11385]|uniref:polysaccharide deacetylase family protein n=1 Tax=Streptomyces sp. SID11385 TaxID=2706031 RepID=UPI0013CDC694|nr:polysaccharide deacetylase family protein [Streptomyces sp. SID11385]NEA40277.1 ChbG/HpnK family deacetylase [Streptomyces sp. SID11385]
MSELSSQEAALASQLLGFSATERVLLVNCDDLGMHPGINAAVVEAIESGIAASCSLMVPCPAAEEAMRSLRERPWIPFGVHLTLVCDAPTYRWGPVAGRGRVPSLVGADGTFLVASPEGRATLLGRARAEEVAVEFRAQIETVLAAGLVPTHLDFHCLADGGRADLLDVAQALAAEYGLAVRVWLAEGRRRARARGLPVVDHPFLDSFSLPVEGRAARYAQLLAALPEGLSEWAVHPGRGDADSRAVDGGWRVRVGDLAFLTSERAAALVREHEVRIVGYQGLRDVWRRVTYRPAATDPRGGCGGL